MHIINPNEDEILDLVDENDNVIGQKPRSEFYAGKNPHFRAINAFIVNSKKQLWIPRRVATKKVFPLYLDASVSGHVKSGETYEQGFERELREELNLKPEDISYSLLGYFTPYKNGTAAFSKAYKITTKVDVPDYNKDDYFEYFWLYPHELIKLAESGENIKSDTIKIVTMFKDLF